MASRIREARRPEYNQSVPLFRRMLVALANEESDAGLLRYAAMLQRLMPGIQPFCIHVAESRKPVAALQANVTHSLPWAPICVETGDTLDTLLDLAAETQSDLILLGHRAGRTRRSLARRLAMKAPCSVWIAPDGCLDSLRSILVPVDLSARSADSLELATELADTAGLEECIALHVHFNDSALTFDEFDQQTAEANEQSVDLFLARINLHGVFARPLLVESPHVAQTILRVASESGSDLIVMGTRGRSSSAAVLLGSETEHVMMHTTVPILAVKHFGSQLRLRQILTDQRLRRRNTERFT